MPAETDVADFSDDLDVNFDMSFVAQASRSEEDHTPNYEIAQAIPSKGIDSQLMRLRGGASDSELKKRKRQPSSSSSGRKKAKAHVTSSRDGHSSARDKPPSIKPLPPIAGFIAGNEESKSHFTSLRMGHRPRTTVHRFQPKQSPAVFTWPSPPPSAPDLLSSMYQLGIPRVIPRSAFYSKDKDVPASTREYGGREFKLVSTSLPYLEEFKSGTRFRKSIFLGKTSPDTFVSRITRIWQIGKRPPILLERNIKTNGEPVLPSSPKPRNAGILSN